MNYIDLKVPADALTSLVTTINTKVDELDYRIKIFYASMHLTDSYKVKLCNVQEIMIYDVLTNQKIITMINDEYGIVNDIFPIDYDLLKKLNFEVVKEYGYLNIFL